jgi:hypothetical protein
MYTYMVVDFLVPASFSYDTDGICHGMRLSTGFNICWVPKFTTLYVWHALLPVNGHVWFQISLLTVGESREWIHQVQSTTRRLQPPSASLILWRKPRNPSSIAACALDPGVDATAAARPELLHGNSPSALNARVPAIQRSNARSHRTVDNSFITARSEYCSFFTTYQRGSTLRKHTGMACR